MIRPFTCICLLLAGGSGLYLYQTKHRTRVLDRQIEQTLKQVEVARSRVGLLQAEWALLNDPQRLAELGDRFLNLKSVAPTQFVTLSELDQRLPAVLPPPPPVAVSSEDPAEPQASQSEGAAVEPQKPEPTARVVAEAAPSRAAETVRAHRAAHAVPATAPAAATRTAETLAVAHRAPRHETMAQSAPPITPPVPLVRPAVVTRVLAMAAPRARAAPPEVYVPPPVEPTARVIGSVMTAAPLPASGSLLGGAHAAMAAPVPASGAAWPRR